MHLDSAMTPVATVAYDANGNTLTDGSGKSYTWDFNNRLIQAIVPNVGTTTFRYDPFGRRIQKSGPLGTTNYLYDGQSLLQESDNSASILARYTATRNIDEPLAELHSSSTISYYEQDGIGTISSITDQTGTVAKTYIYDSFGRLTSSVGALANPFQYTGREFDAETGLNYHRARYYDSFSGRFVSEDPVRFRGGVDFYVYVTNNVLNLVDSLGLQSDGPTLGGCKTGPNVVFFICCKKGTFGFCDGPLAGTHQNDWISDCQKQHERVHIEDFKKQWPNLCSGQKDGTPVCAQEGLKFDLECRAWTDMGKCLASSPETTETMKNEKKHCSERTTFYCSKSGK
jgi:RHS repeat-associated protein